MGIEAISQEIAQMEEELKNIMKEEIGVEVEVDNIGVEEDIIIDIIVVVEVEIVEIIEVGIINIGDDHEVEKEVKIVIIKKRIEIEELEVKEIGVEVEVAAEIVDTNLKIVGIH